MVGKKIVMIHDVGPLASMAHHLVNQFKLGLKLTGSCL